MAMEITELGRHPAERMSSDKTIYILGCGAVGFPLAVFLVKAGRRVLAVRTSQSEVPERIIDVTVRCGKSRISAPIETTSLVALDRLDGTIVVAAKAHANRAIASALRDKGAIGPIVIMQNGVGVEEPFVRAHLSPIYRCIVYATSQATSARAFDFRAVTGSPIGVVEGSRSGLAECISNLTTSQFPFRPDADIQRAIWKKAIINSVFNSICPLLEIDNGVFARDESVAALARDIVAECVALTSRLNIEFSVDELMEQIMQISQRPDGQLISTLQDTRNHRRTEIAFLNLEIARVAGTLPPALDLRRVELLGKLVDAKSLVRGFGHDSPANSNGDRRQK